MDGFDALTVMRNGRTIYSRGSFFRFNEETNDIECYDSETGTWFADYEMGLNDWLGLGDYRIWNYAIE